jgi:endonuclease YncB( thermonuclease family)
VKVYDGDTITIATRIPNDTTVYRFTVRLLGIDSPEMKSQYENEKQLAIQSQNALATLIMDKIVRIGTITFEKYGRILANVYCEGINVSDWMIDNGYAVAYNGKTKQIPDAWRSEATRSEATTLTKSEAKKHEKKAKKN